MIKDYFKLAIGNLIHRKLRSWLTVIGIFIGIAAVVALISLGQGLREAIDQQFQRLGTDKVIILAKGETGPPGSSTASNQLTTKDLEIVQKVNGVDLAAGRLMKAAEVEFKDEIKVLYVIGLPTDKTRAVLEESGSFDTEFGRKLKSSDKYKIIIGNRFAKGDIFNDKLELNNHVHIMGKEFEVVGIIKSTGNPGIDNVIIMNLETSREIFNEPDEQSMIVAKVSSGYTPEQVSENIEKALRREKNQEEGKETFQVQTAKELIQTFTTILVVVQSVLIGLAAISLIVGGIGIANTMYTAVLERTREIGIMKAIGAANKDILFLFLIESGLLGLVGGIIGISIGIGLSKLVEIIAAQAFGTALIQSYFPWYLILGALLFSFLVGSLAGLLPAKQASSMQPVEALRYE